MELTKGIDNNKKLWYNNNTKEKELETMAKKKKKFDGRVLKKEGEELQQYLHFRKRGSVVENKKGKGSYNRQKSKRVNVDE